MIIERVLEIHRRKIPDRLEQPPCVEPVDPALCANVGETPARLR
jgi:hypothetical protein